MKLPMKRPPTSLVTALDVERMVDHLTEVVKAAPKWRPEDSRKWLEIAPRKRLLEGELPFTTHVIEAANLGDEICDAVLCAVFAEMAHVLRETVDTGRPVWGLGHSQIWNYGQHVVLQRAAQHRQRKRRGHSWHDDWMRNIQICMFIDYACRTFGVLPTRNRPLYDRAKHDPGVLPSGVSLVVAALARNGTKRDEWSVQQHIWLGLPGELVRSVLGG